MTAKAQYREKKEVGKENLSADLEQESVLCTVSLEDFLMLLGKQSDMLKLEVSVDINSADPRKGLSLREYADNVAKLIWDMMSY